MADTIELRASNIKCMGCVKAIQEGLSTLDGIKSVDVEIEGGKVTISGEQLSGQQIADKLASLGYPLA